MAPAGGRPGVQPGPSAVSCCVLGSRSSWGHGCGSRAARDWARQGGANRRRPRACRPWVHGVRSTQLRPGSPGPPERTHACGGLGVSRDGAARRKNSCASRPKTHPPSKKRLGRRRFAPAQPGSEYSRFVGRRDGNAADTRPRAGEVFTGGRTVAPALCRPVSGSSDTPNSYLIGEVCWVLPLGSAVFFVGGYTEVEPAQASGSPTVAWGAGRTNGGRPSHEEHARRQTRRIPGPHPH